MILVILGIGLILLAVGITFTAIQKGEYEFRGTFRYWIYNNEWFYWALNTIGAIITSIALIATLILAVDCSSEKAINNQIQIYQEENAAIESTVAEIVNDYQSYEQETFKAFTPEKIMVAVNLYPELKSNELVVKQLEIHAENNEKIKELKSKKASITTYKWWLYFGE